MCFVGVWGGGCMSKAQGGCWHRSREQDERTADTHLPTRKKPNTAEPWDLNPSRTSKPCTHLHTNQLSHAVHVSRLLTWQQVQVFVGNEARHTPIKPCTFAAPTGVIRHRNKTPRVLALRGGMQD